MKIILFLINGWWFVNTGMDIHGLCGGDNPDTFFITGKRGTICRVKVNFETGEIEKNCKGFGDKLLTSISFYGRWGMAVGESGSIFVTEDGGENFTPSFSPVNYHLLDVEVLSEKVDEEKPSIYAVAVGDWGTILITRDGGKNWEEHSLEKKFEGDFIGEPVLSRDFMDEENKKTYKKGEILSYETLKELYKKRKEIYVRDDVILNDVIKWGAGRFIIAGERGRIFIITKEGKLEKELNVFDYVHNPNFTGEETLFFLAVKDNKIFTGGSTGYLQYFEMKNIFPQNFKTLLNFSETQETIFSGDFKGDNICLAGSDGFIAYSFDAGKTFARLKNERFTVKHFRRALSLEDGCVFGGEGGYMVRVKR